MPRTTSAPRQGPDQHRDATPHTLPATAPGCRGDRTRCFGAAECMSLVRGRRARGRLAPATTSCLGAHQPKLQQSVSTLHTSAQKHTVRAARWSGAATASNEVKPEKVRPVVRVRGHTPETTQRQAATRSSAAAAPRAIMSGCAIPYCACVCEKGAAGEHRGR